MRIRGYLSSKYRLVCIFLTFHRPLGCFSVNFSSFVQSCERLVLAGSSDRGVVNQLWVSPQWSNRLVVLCEGSQDVLLQSSGGVLVLNCPSCVLEGSKVGGMSQRLQPAEVDRV